MSSELFPGSMGLMMNGWRNKYEGGSKWHIDWKESYWRSVPATQFVPAGSVKTRMAAP
jgi:hypothetical protein